MPYLNECGIVCALGDTHDAIRARLFERAEVLTVGGGQQSLMKGVEVGEVFGRRVVRGTGGEFAGDERVRGEEVADVLTGQRRDDESATRQQLEEALDP